MLANIKNNNIFIHNFDQELLTTTLLTFCLFNKCLLTMVYLKSIADIQYKI